LPSSFSSFLSSFRPSFLPSFLPTDLPIHLLLAGGGGEQGPEEEMELQKRGEEQVEY
jgi:hypothetical protein